MKPDDEPPFVADAPIDKAALISDELALIEEFERKRHRPVSDEFDDDD